ncbi:sigma factor-like helix-turn-helix DNA-binding protein [Streptomyces sp. NPDC054783]
MPERTDTAADDRAGTATQVFADHRELLLAIVHNMLGSVTDTEDVLQDTWLSWTGRKGRARSDGIDNPRACLVRIAVNHARARRAGITRRRASLERAVFVLNELFEYTHAEIADVLDRSPAAVRRQATERFVQAGPRPMHGRNKAALLPAGYATRRGADFGIRHQPVNGDDAAVVFEGESPYAVMVMDLTPEGDRMSDVFIVTNPDKIAHAPRNERVSAQEERA